MQKAIGCLFEHIYRSVNISEFFIYMENTIKINYWKSHHHTSNFHRQCEFKMFAYLFMTATIIEILVII